MNKFFLSTLLIAGAALTASADSEPKFVEFPTPEFLNETGGTQVVAISRNGRYLSGGTYQKGGFVYDALNDTTILIGAVGVTDDGRVLNGYGLADLYTKKISQMLEFKGQGYAYFQTAAVSADGNIIVGMAGPDWTHLSPYYWENGKMIALPFPSTEEVKTFKVNGCQARWVSDDGSVIVGYFVANPNTNLMIVWLRQEDGTYKYIDTWTDWYEPVHGWAYNPETKEDFIVKGPNPWMRMEPGAVTGDGKHVAMYIQDNSTDKAVPPMQFGFYHIETGELEVFTPEQTPTLWNADEFIICGISNDLTLVGITGALARDPMPYVMEYGQDAVYLNDLYPQFDRLFEYEDWNFAGFPYLCTGISEDGRYICGYSTQVVEYHNDMGQTATDLGFYGYLIDRGDAYSNTPSGGDDSAVEALEADLEDIAPEYYTLEGLRVEHPSRGIYIERRGSQSRKVRL